MLFVAIVVAVTAAATGFAFRPALQGTATFYLTLLGAYILMSALALYKMWDDGTLVDRLRPRWGDLSMGAITAAVLLVASWGARALLAPAGNPRQSWLLHIYLQIGASDTIQRSAWITLAVLAIAVLEEIVWRGLVLDQLAERFSSRRAWPLAALLYAVAHVPTVFTLADPIAGPNPLIVIAALGCGIVWSFMAAFVGRLPPVMISHAAFTYFSAVQFRLPGL